VLLSFFLPLFASERVNHCSSVPSDFASGNASPETASHNASFPIQGEPASVQFLPAGYTYAPELLPRGGAYNTSFSYSVASSRGQAYFQYSFSPYFLRNDSVFCIDTYCISFIPQNTLAAADVRLKSSANSPLASGRWVRLEVGATGVQKISGADLKSYGFSDVSSLRIFGGTGAELSRLNAERLNYLPEFPLAVSKSGAVFADTDYVLFYAQAAGGHLLTADGHYLPVQNNIISKSYIYLTVNNGQPKQIQEEPPGQPEAGLVLDSYDKVISHSGSNYNIKMSGARWFDRLNPGATFNSYFEGAIIGAEAYYSHYLATDNMGTNVQFSASGVSAGNISAPADNYHRTITGTLATPRQDISMKASFVSQGNVWLGHTLLAVPCQLRIGAAGQLLLQNRKAIGYQRVQYNISGNFYAWDVTDIYSVKSLAASQAPLSAPGGNSRIAVFNGAQFHRPSFVSAVENQNLAGSGTADMIIICRPSTLEQAQRFADYRMGHSGISSLVVTQEQIFNEFSFGAADAGAIRDFARAMYEKDRRLKYLLLMGDGSYDNKLINTEKSYLVTFQSSTSGVNSFTSDDFFGMLEPGEGENPNGRFEGEADLAIGRFPVSSPEEAAVIIDKIVHYETSPKSRGSWRNRLIFLADDGDNNLHMSQAEELSILVSATNGAYLHKKIYADSYKKLSTGGRGWYPELNKKLWEELGVGALVFNYTGHGNPYRMGGERFLASTDVPNLKNIDMLPIVITASCEVSRYDNHSQTSLGEIMMLHAGGGAIAMLTTTRLVYAYPNFVLNKQIYKCLWKKDSMGNQISIGEVLRLAKIALNSDFSNNKRNFTLLGDPSMLPAVPQLSVGTDSINGIDALLFTDTVAALHKMSISGSIRLPNGEIDQAYSGNVLVTVLDKSRKFVTLDSSGEGALEYQQYVNYIFRGNADVANGHFSLEFIVPKDINYIPGNAKILYYADNGTHDANGGYDSLIVGGISGNTYNDNTGPQIRLFMNDTTFRNGGTTNSTPVFLALLTDESGINISGSAIGHDLEAMLNNQWDSIMILNSYYQADPGTYAKGRLYYRLPELKDGPHTIRLKAWDVNNNPSEAELDFVVAGSFKAAVKYLMAHPNPMQEQSVFTFEHNLAEQDLRLRLEIMNQSGQRAALIEWQGYAGGFLSGELHWDGTDARGAPVAPGVYICRLIVETKDGTTAAATERLVVIR
jgi:hypothetical protein